MAVGDRPAIAAPQLDRRVFEPAGLHSLLFTARQSRGTDDGGIVWRAIPGLYATDRRGPAESIKGSSPSPDVRRAFSTTEFQRLESLTPWNSFSYHAQPWPVRQGKFCAIVG